MKIYYKELLLFILIFSNTLSQKISDKEGLVNFLISNDFNQSENIINQNNYIDVGKYFSLATSVDINNSSNCLAAGYEDGMVRIWDLNKGGVINQYLAHNGSVKFIKYSPNDKLLVTAGEDKTIKLWDAISYTIVSTFYIYNNTIYTLTISSDLSKLAAAGSDGKIYIWDITKNKLITSFDAHNGAINSLTFSLNNSKLISGGNDSVVKVWNSNNWMLISQTLKANGSINSVNISKDEIKIISSCSEGSLIVSNSITGDTIRIIKDNNFLLRNAFYNFSCDKVITGDYNSNIIIRDADKFEVLKKFKFEGFLSSITLDGTKAALNCGESITIVDLEKGIKIKNLGGHSKTISAIAVSPDGNIVATGSWDNTVKLWNLSNGYLITSLDGHTDGILSLAFSPDGERLVSAGFDRFVKEWAVKSGTLLYDLKGHSNFIWKVDFSPDGSLIASSDWNNVINLWDTYNGKLINTFYNAGSSFSFSKDGQKIIAGSLDYLKVFDLNGKLLRDLTNSQMGILTIASSQDNKFATGSLERIISLFDLNTYTLLKKITHNISNITSIQFSNNGSIIATGGGNYICLYDIYTGNLLHKIEMDISSINFKFSKDCNNILVSRDKYLRSYNISSFISQKNLTGNIFFNGNPLNDVKISISGSANLSSLSDKNGYYSFSLNNGGSYIVIPNKNGYVFDPQYYEIINLTKDEKRDFLAKLAKVTIEGKVLYNNQPLTNTNVNLSQSGVIKETIKTDEYGKYSFIVDALKDYTINPFKAGYYFQPTEKSFKSLVENQIIDFVAFNNITLDVNSNNIKSTSIIQNYPNPFNSSSTILYTLKEPSKVLLKVYNIYGKEIEVLVNELQKSGSYSVVWKPYNISSGVYYAALSTKNSYQVIKLIYLK